MKKNLLIVISGLMIICLVLFSPNRVKEVNVITRSDFDTFYEDVRHGKMYTLDGVRSGFSSVSYLLARVEPKLFGYEVGFTGVGGYGNRYMFLKQIKLDNRTYYVFSNDYFFDEENLKEALNHDWIEIGQNLDDYYVCTFMTRNQFNF